MFRKYSIFVLVLISFLSCKDDIKVDDKLKIRIGISREPSALLPFKRQGNVEKQINPYLYLQLADFDPITLKNIPVLLEKLPSETHIDTGKYRKTYRYNLSFKSNAKWDNGSSITGNDYLFSVKILLNPMIDMHPVIPSLYKNIIDIVVDKGNPQNFSVYAKDDYMLTKELVANMEIYPEYFYDSLKVMRNIDLQVLQNSKEALKVLEHIEGAKELAKKYNSSYFMRDNISNSGPYKLNKWLSNQYVELIKKENYWAKDVNNIYLKNNPDKIVFKILPDKTTALSELKNYNIDLLHNVNGSDFLKMKNDESYNKQFDFFSPLSLRYNVIILNNRRPILKDKNVRRALAHLIDMDFIIKMNGTGKEKRLISPIHPSKPYYNKDLKPIDFDVKKAISLLKNSGWSDSNGDGVLDKYINNKQINLKLSITISGNKFSKNIALLLKENAKKAGVEIEILNRGKKNYRKDKRSFNFDLIVAGSSKDIVDYDPYPKWHSDNIGAGSSNQSGFVNNDCDRIIEQIRSEKDKQKLYKLYRGFQKIIYDEQPVIFLYVPTNNIIINKKYSIKTSVKKPGYFANTTQRTK